MSDIERILTEAALQSDCSKIRFGAALIAENEFILSTGWNHNPRASKGYSCAAHCVGGIRAGVKSGTCVERCYAVHAEQDALVNSDRSFRYPPYRVAVLGLLPDGSLFDNGGGFYCTVCARLMAAAGVREVTIWTLGKPHTITIQEAWDQSYAVATA